MAGSLATQLLTDMRRRNKILGITKGTKRIEEHLQNEFEKTHFCVHCSSTRDVWDALARNCARKCAPIDLGARLDLLLNDIGLVSSDQ
eukprot:4838624-Amphidinium_carterae.1